MTIQRNRLERMVDETDPEFVGELLELFLSEFPQLLSNLWSSFRQGDAAGVSLYAHTLKGSSRQFGLEDLGNVFQELEQMGDQNALDGGEPILTRTGDMFTEATNSLKNFVNDLLIPHAA